MVPFRQNLFNPINIQHKTGNHLATSALGHAILTHKLRIGCLFLGRPTAIGQLRKLLRQPPSPKWKKSANFLNGLLKRWRTQICDSGMKPGRCWLG